MGKMTLKIKIVLIPQFISDVLCASSEQVTKISFATLKKKNLPLGEAGGVHPCLVTSLGLYLQRTHMLVLPAHAVSFSHDTACTSNWREHTVYISLCNQIYRVFVVKTAPGSC